MIVFGDYKLYYLRLVRERYKKKKKLKPKKMLRRFMRTIDF